MHCFKCGSDHNKEDRFCSNCGSSLANESIKNISISGAHSFNAGQNNNIAVNNLSIGSEKHRPDVYISRVKITPITLGGHPIKVAWVIVSSAVGMVGSIASIWSVWASGYQFFSFLLFWLCFIALLVSIPLSRHRFMRLPFINLESNKLGEIFSTKIQGKCPNCDGILKLRDIGPEGNKRTIARCTRNPDHYWRFDPTVLDEPLGRSSSAP